MVPVRVVRLIEMVGFPNLDGQLWCRAVVTDKFVVSNFSAEEIHSSVKHLISRGGCWIDLRGRRAVPHLVRGRWLVNGGLVAEPWRVAESVGIVYRRGARCT